MMISLSELIMIAFTFVIGWSNLNFYSLKNSIEDLTKVTKELLDKLK